MDVRSCCWAGVERWGRLGDLDVYVSRLSCLEDRMVNSLKFVADVVRIGF